MDENGKIITIFLNIAARTIYNGTHIQCSILGMDELLTSQPVSMILQGMHVLCSMCWAVVSIVLIRELWSTHGFSNIVMSRKCNCIYIYLYTYFSFVTKLVQSLEN